MPRIRKFTDEDLTTFIEKGWNITQLSKKFGASPVTIYLHARRLGIEVKSKRLKSRMFTDDELRKAVSTSSSKLMAASKLSTTYGTIDRHMRRLNLKLASVNKVDDEQALAMFKGYKNEVTLDDLAKHFNKPVSTIVACITRVVNVLWSTPVVEDRPKWPKPHGLTEVKIYHLAEQWGHKLKQMPDRIPKSRGLTYELCLEYLDREIVEEPDPTPRPKLPVYPPSIKPPTTPDKPKIVKPASTPIQPKKGRRAAQTGGGAVPEEVWNG